MASGGKWNPKAIIYKAHDRNLLGIAFGVRLSRAFLGKGARRLVSGSWQETLVLLAFEFPKRFSLSLSLSLYASRVNGLR